MGLTQRCPSFRVAYWLLGTYSITSHAGHGSTIERAPATRHLLASGGEHERKETAERDTKLMARATELRSHPSWGGWRGG